MHLLHTNSVMGVISSNQKVSDPGGDYSDLILDKDPDPTLKENPTLETNLDLCLSLSPCLSISPSFYLSVFLSLSHTHKHYLSLSLSVAVVDLSKLRTIF